MIVARLHTKYNPVKFDPDTLAYRDAVNTVGGALTTRELIIINHMLRRLKHSGLWGKMVGLYPFCGSTGDIKATHSVNLKTPGTHDLIFNNTVAGDHLVSGWTGNGSTSYAQTGIIPSTHLTDNDVHMSYSTTTTGQLEKREIACLSVGNTSHLDWLVYRSTGNGEAFIYDTSNGTVSFSLTTGAGNNLVTRRSATDAELYQDGVSKGTSATGGGAVPTVELYINALNNNGTAAASTSREVQVASIGSSFTDTDATNFHNIVNTFNNAIR